MVPGGYDVGRLDAGVVDSGKLVYDAPEQAVKAMLTKLDQVIAWQNAVGAAIETATDAASLFTALDVAAIKAALAKLKFNL